MEESTLIQRWLVKNRTISILRHARLYILNSRSMFEDDSAFYAYTLLVDLEMQIMGE